MDAVPKSIAEEYFIGCPNISHLYCADCALRNIGKALFRHTQKLKYLGLQKNKIGNPMRKDIFLYLENLEYLDLSKNLNFPIVEADVFDSLHQIKVLKMSSVPTLGHDLPTLTRILAKLSTLEQLNLFDFGIQSLPINLFKNLSDLNTLVLGKNEISYWNPGVFKTQKYLETLVLSVNKIVSLSQNSFIHLHSLKHLDLSGNPFGCTCDLLWFRQWIDTSSDVLKSINPSNYACASPPELRNTFLLEFSPTEDGCTNYSQLIICLATTMVYFIAVTVLTLIIRYKWYIR